MNFPINQYQYIKSVEPHNEESDLSDIMMLADFVWMSFNIHCFSFLVNSVICNISYFPICYPHRIYMRVTQKP